MKCLIACEESGRVTKAFREKGHDAWSCDLLPTSGDLPQYHLQQDVTELLKENWDLVIAFPPCTNLCISGAKHFEKKRKDGSQQAGIDFFLLFTKLKCKWAIENPIGIMSTIYRKPNQIISPHEFGDNFKKKTCLWLNELPLLKPKGIYLWDSSNDYIAPSGKRMSRWYYETSCLPHKDRATARSKTSKLIADAMAEQWG
jgi:hypothetical protein